MILKHRLQLNITGWFCILPILFLLACQSPQSDLKPPAPNPGIPSPQNGGDAPVTIYRGLNDCNSGDWVDMARQGHIGLVYFDPDSSSEYHRVKRLGIRQSGEYGRLVYRCIFPDGRTVEETVKEGNRLNIAILRYDRLDNPHIFLARSNDTEQSILMITRLKNGDWKSDTIIEFDNDSGKYIYEMSGQIGADGQIHLLILKTRSNPDSSDYYHAFIDARLIYANFDGSHWHTELIKKYDTLYTMNEYVKASRRQDMAIDRDGHVHVVFGEQINGLSNHSPSRLIYAKRQAGQWRFENALSEADGSRDSAGWYPSLAIDRDNNPAIACLYVSRVPSGSARFGHLIYLIKDEESNWIQTTVEQADAGYYGGDGRQYTGGLSDLVFDQKNSPHILFCDIASSHAPGRGNYFNLGQIRYARQQDGKWRSETIYMQPLPDSFDNATELYNQCLLLSEQSETIAISVIAQELVITGENEYKRHLIHQHVRTDN